MAVDLSLAIRDYKDGLGTVYQIAGICTEAGEGLTNVGGNKIQG
jgi:hypothetical protein